MAETNDPMAEIRASFFIECEELLEALQDGLQVLYDGSADAETINVVFRAVHSIKGGAGAFGLEALVRFAHRFETVLDEVRSGRMSPDAEALKIFFKCADHLLDLVRVSRDSGPLPDEETAKLLALLDGIIGQESGNDQDEHEDDIDFQPALLSLDLDIGEEEEGGFEIKEIASLEASECWYLIRFKPETELFETGNEPFQVLRALDEMGSCTVTCHTEVVPGLAELAPEKSYLQWIISLKSNVEEAEIAAAFEFVEGLCELEITRKDQVMEPLTSTSASDPDLADMARGPLAPYKKLEMADPGAQKGRSIKLL